MSINSECIKCGMIKLGIWDGTFEKGKNVHSFLNLQDKSQIVFEGNAAIANSFTINNGGKLTFGKNFSSNYGLFISCMSSVEFGDDCLLGWNNTFIDNDGHKVISDNGKCSIPKTIEIGNHNWITSETTFLKGSSIGDNNVVGYGAFVKNNFASENDCLIAGNPANRIKSIRGWEK